MKFCELFENDQSFVLRFVHLQLLGGIFSTDMLADMYLDNDAEHIKDG